MRSARFRSFLPLILLAPALVLGGTPAPSQADEQPVDLSAPLPLDPGIAKRGTLDNGLTYWVVPHAMPKGKVMLLLHVSSGSLQEEESQRGLAHFLEHMAFNGSENFPANEVMSFFEAMGMRFGQHQNAFTSFDQTTYMLSLPDTKPETIEKGLLFFGDVAHRLTISQEEVDKERGVILEEERARQGVQQRMMEQSLPKLLPGSRLAERIPIGVHEVITKAPAERLRAYYERWYRPERSTLVVVGDVDPEKVAPRLEKAFADWRGKGEAPAEIEAGMKPRSGLDAAVLTDPEQTNATLRISRIRPDTKLEHVGDYRDQLAEQLAYTVLNRRFQRMVQEDRAKFIGAGISRGQPIAGLLLGGLGAQAACEDWAAALEQMVGEIRRLREHGIEETELQRTKDAVMAGLQQMAETADSRPAQGVAMRLNGAITRGRKPMSAAQRLELAVALYPTITAKEASEAFRRTVNPEEGLILLSLPEKEGQAAPSSDEALAVYRKALATEVEKGDVRQDVGRILERDPEPGAVASRESEPGLGVTTLVMENGVVVHLRPVASSESVIVRIRLSGGVVEETAKNRGITGAASLAFAPGSMATARFKPADFTQVLEPLKASVGGGSDDLALSLTVSSPADGIEDGLRLAYLLLTEPRVDAGALSRWKRELGPQLKAMETNIQAQAFLALQRIASGDDVRMRVPTLEQSQGVSQEDAQAWLDRIVREAPLEVVITGGIDEAAAEKLARTFFGSLPKRPDRWAEIKALRKVSPGKGPVVENVAVDTITPVAIVFLGWQGVSTDDAKRFRALRHATSILNPRLLKAVREDRGLTYSIGSGYMTTGYEGMGGVMVNFTADPQKAEEAAQVAKDVVLELLENGPDDDEIVAVERQMENVLESQMQTPAFWASALSRLRANGRTLSEARTRLNAMKTVDKAAVMEALAHVLKDERFARIIAAPGKPAGEETGEEKAPVDAR